MSDYETLHAAVVHACDSWKGVRHASDPIGLASKLLGELRVTLESLPGPNDTTSTVDASELGVDDLRDLVIAEAPRPPDAVEKDALAMVLKSLTAAHARFDVLELLGETNFSLIESQGEILARTTPRLLALENPPKRWWQFWKATPTETP